MKRFLHPKMLWGGAGVAILFGVLLLVLLPPPPLFRLEEIVVTPPPTRLTEEALVQMTGVRRGDHLLRVSLKSVRKNLLVSPWIEEVVLARAYPGRLVISIEEEVPVALVQLEGLYLLNREGVAFKKLGGEDPKNLPIITGLKKPTRKELKGFVRLIQIFQGTEVLKSVGLSEIHWDSKKGVSFFTVRPVVQVLLGKQRFEERLTRLARILPELEGQKKLPESIDLTYEKRIFLKPKV